MPESATYVYCIVKSSSPPRAGRAPRGLPRGTAPSVVPFGPSLWLVVANVPLDIYGPDRLEAALRDMPWVADVAMAHEAVVEHFSRSQGSTVIPMKLFTMFSTEDRAVAEMRGRRQDLQAVLKRLQGCEEWGVRVTRSAASRQASAGRPSAVRATSGAGFLAAKKQARDDARETARAAAEAAEDAFALLAAVARETRRRDEAPAGAATPPLLDATFLVPGARRARFRTAARKAAAACAKGGAEITLSGPWPAYNFVQPGENRQ
jgi:gas vesicle protein GvpL/GvpF